ncbi:hypothetical protein SARC_15300 [Sphaeroforma arctica JP610]|uniref:Protein kinase domain-containing protein n=1 Tax=Sphaeroforma arctica JP610 TaxID=667725 RepID=A0A0L0F7P7_9EUKA|nr:hypothetical protein SARC_15300 [Sphaeroforma arctica JP610]KNC72148.1 hypothetical protein SARC_15300 [Sphaeroforma arctica JP610]|eukprot:XP_014146050.1 hypothetical protein SARC_15300 [Sphaeroforma arctica JP610]
MRDLRHSNIVRIIGVSGVDESERAEICILMEFLPEGDLCHYLRKNTQISEAERLSFCYQIADACAYIANHGLVHRDLAARNCLLGSTGPHGYPVCKVRSLHMVEDV